MALPKLFPLIFLFHYWMPDLFVCLKVANYSRSPVVLINSLRLYGTSTKRYLNVHLFQKGLLLKQDLTSNYQNRKTAQFITYAFKFKFTNQSWWFRCMLFTENDPSLVPFLLALFHKYFEHISLFTTAHQNTLYIFCAPAVLITSCPWQKYFFRDKFQTNTVRTKLRRNHSNGLFTNTPIFFLFLVKQCPHTGCHFTWIFSYTVENTAKFHRG